MDWAWPIGFGAAAGMFAFVGQCVEDALRVGVRAYLRVTFHPRFGSDRLRKSLLVQLASCVAGGTVFGLIVIAARSIVGG